MSRILGIILKWIGGKIATLVFIVAILLAGVFVKSAWTEMLRMKDEVRIKQTLSASLKTELVEIERKLKVLEAKEKAERERVMQKLTDDLAGIKKEIARTGGELSKQLDKLSDLEATARSLRKNADDARPRLAKARSRIGVWELLSPVPTENEKEVAAATLTYNALAAAAQTAEAARDTQSKMLGTSSDSELLKKKALKESEMASASARVSPEMKPLTEDQKRKEKEIAEVHKLIEAQRERIANDPKERIFAAVREQLPIALSILAGLIVTPIAFKGFFYFVLAPLASKLPPIRILPSATTPPIPKHVASRVSLDFEIGADEEILVHSDFLQGTEVL